MRNCWGQTDSYSLDCPWPRAHRYDHHTDTSHPMAASFLTPPPTVVGAAGSFQPGQRVAAATAP
jgi:hypothetical protein